MNKHTGSLDTFDNWQRENFDQMDELLKTSLVDVSDDYYYDEETDEICAFTLTIHHTGEVLGR